MEIASLLNNGKYQINKSAAFCELQNFTLPKIDLKFTDIIKEIDNKLIEKYPDITREARSNAHGDWYEWFLAITAWNYFLMNDNSFLALPLPNKLSFQVESLYTQELYDLILDLKEKVAESTSVQLISSNPDFVIIDTKNIDFNKNKLKIIKSLNIDTLNVIDSYYTNFINKCNFDDIIGYLSVKFSLRPDRRLQIPHEGSLMKAIYTHLQTRMWILRPRGLKYYAFSAEINEPDKNALRTVATHSITTVHNIPQAAVDDVFQVNTFSEALTAFKNILHD